MSTPADMTRRRLCQLLGIDEKLHRRWCGAELGLLRARKRYESLDLQRAAALNALWRQLGDALATVTWTQIGDQLDVVGTRLEVVVDLATDRAVIARSASELDEALPRGVRTIAVDVAAAVREATERLQQFRAAHSAVRPRTADRRQVSVGRSSAVDQEAGSE